MKKALKITGIALAVITLLIILLCIFTGILPYMYTKLILAEDSEIAYSEWAHYDAGTISGNTVSYDGLYVTLPADMHNAADKDGNIRENVFTAGTDGKPSASVIITERSTQDMPSVSQSLHERAENRDMSDTDRKNATKAIDKYDRAVERYCAGIGRTPPHDRYSFMDMMYSTRADNISFFDKDAATVQAFVLTFKSMIAASAHHTAYRFETGTGMGFISPYGDAGEKYMIELYDKNDLDTSYTIAVYAQDEETMYGIINSLRIDYTPEQEE